MGTRLRKGEKKMYHKKKEEDIRSPLDYGFSKIDGKWSTRILCELFSFGPLRYSELKTGNTGITDSVLSSALFTLVDAKLVEKGATGENQKCPSVFYSLTAKGEQVVHSLKDICHLVSLYEESSSYKIPSYCQHCSGIQSSKY